MTIGDEITLTGKTNKGRECLRFTGATKWIILQIEESVLFSSEKGPWLLIRPNMYLSSRWVHARQDLNFEIKF